MKVKKWGPLGYFSHVLHFMSLTIQEKSVELESKNFSLEVKLRRFVRE